MWNLLLHLRMLQMALLTLYTKDVLQKVPDNVCCLLHEPPVPYYKMKRQIVIFLIVESNCCFFTMDSLVQPAASYANFNLGVWPNNFLYYFIPGGCHSITSLQELDKAVAEIGDWEALCEYLGVHKAVLTSLCDMINTDNTVKKHRCLKAYINTAKTCWEQVVEVIADYPFYNARLAEEIANMHVVI